jgi:hypothetical protein
MLGILFNHNSSFHTAAPAIILQSGLEQVKGVWSAFPPRLLIVSFLRPKNKEELFNLRHASAHNVIERIFGILKHCFWILLLPLEYDLDIQARLPAGLAALHNFIRLHEPNPTDNEEEDDAQLEDEGDEDGGNGGATNEPAPSGSNIANATVVEERSAASAMQDRIAQQMWDDYLVVLSGCRDLEESDDDSIDSDVYSHI